MRHYRRMKKILFLLTVLLPLLASSAAGRNVPKSKITSFIYECQRYEGVEVVQLGGLAAMALRATIRVAATDDPEVRDVLKLITGIKRISVLNYEQCEPAVQARISRKLDRVLDGSDLLMETRDGDDLMQIYGVVDEKTGTVNDFVLHNPTNASLICIFGSIPIEKIARVIADND